MRDIGFFGARSQGGLWERALAALMIVVVMLLIGCAGVNLTPDEQARATISEIRAELKAVFDTAKAFNEVGGQSYRKAYKNDILPNIERAYLILRGSAEMGKAINSKPLSTTEITASIRPIIAEIVGVLVEYGVLS